MKSTPPPDIKTINLKEKEFMANGKKYRFLDKISVARYKEYEKLQVIIALGATPKQIFDNIKKSFSLLNKPSPEPVSAGIILHNIMSAIADLNDPKRVHPALLMATLFIAREGEDLRVFNMDEALDKINDWEEEGLDMTGFITVSLSTIQGLRDTLKEFTQENELLQEVKDDLKKK